MNLTGLILAALFTVQADPMLSNIEQDASEAMTPIDLPGEGTEDQPELISDSTWQNTELETLIKRARESLV